MEGTGRRGEVTLKSRTCVRSGDPFSRLSQSESGSLRGLLLPALRMLAKKEPALNSGVSRRGFLGREEEPAYIWSSEEVRT